MQPASAGKENRVSCENVNNNFGNQMILMKQNSIYHLRYLKLLSLFFLV